MPELPSIQRSSLTTNLETRYDQSTDLANVGGGSAKDVGAIATNVIDNTAVGQGKEWAQKEFTLKANKGITSFTENGLQYATNTLKVPTTKYAPSGRL